MNNASSKVRGLLFAPGPPNCSQAFYDLGKTKRVLAK